MRWAIPKIRFCVACISVIATELCCSIDDDIKYFCSCLYRYRFLYLRLICLIEAYSFQVDSIIYCLHKNS
jgi:hypothetical protein